MNKAIETALKTWYPKNHTLHLDPIHPAMGLAGEVGEILNKRKKDLFKENYEWSDLDELDELGDVWYYIRILSYQFGIEITDRIFKVSDLDVIRANLSINAMQVNGNFQVRKIEKAPRASLRKCQMWLNTYLKILEMTLDELTALNWEKLKPGSERGDEWTSSW